MTKERERELKGHLLRLAMYGQCMGDDMEELKGTRVYKGLIKYHANGLVNAVSTEFSRLVEQVHRDADNDTLASMWSDIEYVIQFVGALSTYDMKLFVEQLKLIGNGQEESKDMDVERS